MKVKFVCREDGATTCALEINEEWKPSELNEKVLSGLKLPTYYKIVSYSKRGNDGKMNTVETSEVESILRFNFADNDSVDVTVKMMAGPKHYEISESNMVAGKRNAYRAAVDLMNNDKSDDVNHDDDESYVEGDELDCYDIVPQQKKRQRNGRRYEEKQRAQEAAGKMNDENNKKLASSSGIPFKLQGRDPKSLISTFVNLVKAEGNKRVADQIRQNEKIAISTALMAGNYTIRKLSYEDNPKQLDNEDEVVPDEFKKDFGAYEFSIPDAVKICRKTRLITNLNICTNKDVVLAMIASAVNVDCHATTLQPTFLLENMPSVFWSIVFHANNITGGEGIPVCGNWTGKERVISSSFGKMLDVVCPGIEWTSFIEEHEGHGHRDRKAKSRGYGK